MRYLGQRGNRRQLGLLEERFEQRPRIGVVPHPLGGRANSIFGSLMQNAVIRNDVPQGLGRGPHPHAGLAHDRSFLNGDKFRPRAGHLLLLSERINLVRWRSSIYFESPINVFIKCHNM